MDLLKEVTFSKKTTSNTKAISSLSRMSEASSDVATTMSSAKPSRSSTMTRAPAKYRKLDINDDTDDSDSSDGEEDFVLKRDSDSEDVLPSNPFVLEVDDEKHASPSIVSTTRAGVAPQRFEFDPNHKTMPSLSVEAVAVRRANEARRIEQLRDDSNAGLNSFFDEIHDLTAMGARGQHSDRTEIFIREGADDCDWERLQVLVNALNIAPEESFVSVYISALIKTAIGREVLTILLTLIAPLLLAHYSVLDFFLKARFGRALKSPDHKDVHSGSRIFRRIDGVAEGGNYAAGTRPGIRLLINIAGFQCHANTRFMRYTVVNGSSSTVALESHARFVAMDANGAGSGTLSNVLHGRYGWGVTASFDLGLPLGSGKPALDVIRSRDVDPAIHGWFTIGRANHGVRGYVQQVAGYVERDAELLAAAQARAAASPGHSRDELHCSRCGCDSLGDKWYSGERAKLGRICSLCFLEFSRLLGRDRYRGVVKTFVKLTTCGIDCTGCAKTVQRRFVPPMTAYQNAGTRAEAAKADPPGAVLHCWFCGDRMNEELKRHYMQDPAVDTGFVFYCNACFNMFKREGERPRQFDCSLVEPLCTGCRAAKKRVRQSKKNKPKTN